MPVQINSKLWRSYKWKDWKLSPQYGEYSRSNKKKFIICLSIFVVGFMWAFLVEGSLWLSFIIGIAFAVLPFAMCFALAVVNRNSIFGGLRKATSLGLELNKSYGLFFWKQITHYGIFHCEEQFEYSLIREIIVFPKRSSLLIFTGGYSSSYLTGELPKTVRYYPTSEHSFAGRWILIPLVFEDNNGVVSHLASVSHVQVRISDSVDLESLE